MQEPDTTKGHAEVLVWMGTAYGRRKNAEPAAAPSEHASEQTGEQAAPASLSINALTVFRRPRWAGAWAATSKNKRAILAGVGFSAIVIAVALVQVRASASLPDATQIATDTQEPTQQEVAQPEPAAVPPASTEPTSVQPSPVDPSSSPPASVEPSKNAEARAELERAGAEAQKQIASEHEARVSAEGKVEQLTAELAMQTRNRETAERASAEANAALETERKARVAAEDANKSSQEELARMAKTAAAAAIAATPVPQQAAQAEPQSRAEPQAEFEPQAEPKAQVAPPPPESQPAAWEASVQVVKASINVEAANAALLQGEELFAKGDLDAARRRFEQAAKMGMPEAALALGNTYDGVSLAKAGLNTAGDPMRARRWYRRALELAQIQQEPRRQ